MSYRWCIPVALGLAAACSPGNEETDGTSTSTEPPGGQAGEAAGSGGDADGGAPASTGGAPSAGGASACVPDCAGKVCGSDGCTGSCGECDGGSCVEGACVDEPPVEDCSQYPFSAQALLAERVGFGRNVTGGDPTNVYHVTTLDPDGPGSLRVALESDEPYWIVFDVNGKITHQERVRPKSNKTIDGRGRDIDIEGQLELKDVSNLIISDVKVENSLEGHCTQDGDVINTDSDIESPPGTYTMHDVWIHHVEAFNGGDGLIDFRAGTNYTVSWTHFHTHKKGLLWHNEIDMMKITAHHNFMDRLSLRGPQFIGGQIHFFNNYQFEWFEYGAGGLGEAQFYSEGNIYQARPGETCTVCEDPNPCGDTEYFPTPVSKSGLVDEWAGNGQGFTKSVGDLALEGAEISVHEPNQVFDPSAEYSYVADAASEALAQQIREEAGPRVDYCANGVP